MKKLTREERRRRSQRWLQLITYLLFLLLLLAWLGSYLIMTAEAGPVQYKAEIIKDDGRLPGDDTPATTRCYMTEDEVEQAENEMIEQALLARSHKLEDVKITFYCCEARPHICGTGTGITASGRRVTPYVSCAVDPDVIPLGADVLVDYGDGEINYYRADDIGGSIRGNRIDLCVSSHQEALELGRRTATVWWVMPE